VLTVVQYCNKTIFKRNVSSSKSTLFKIQKKVLYTIVMVFIDPDLNIIINFNQTV